MPNITWNAHVYATRGLSRILIAALASLAYCVANAQDIQFSGAERDIYALGVIGMVMILKQSPSDTHEKRMREVSIAATVSPEWAWLLKRCTSTDPQLRPCSQALALELSNHATAYAKDTTAKLDPVTLKQDLLLEEKTEECQHEAATGKNEIKLLEAQRAKKLSVEAAMEIMRVKHNHFGCASVT